MRTANHDIASINYLDPKVEHCFLQILQEFQPDVVHCHNLLGLSSRIPIISKDFGARVFLTLHDFWGFCSRNTLMRPDGSLCVDWNGCESCVDFDPAILDPLRSRQRAMQAAFACVDTIIVPSDYVRQKYMASGLSIGPIHLIRNGINLDRFAKITPARAREFSPEDPLRLLYVGYLGGHKGVQLLPAAVPLMRHGSKIQVSFVGEGPAERELRAYAARGGLGHIIRFKGKMQPVAIAHAYDASDVVILPSIWAENQPVCLMEAMASGRAVVASHIGGVPEMFDHGQEGLMFLAGDPAALAAALDQLIDHPDMLVNMGRKGQRRMAEQTYKNQADSILRLFSSYLT